MSKKSATAKKNVSSTKKNQTNKKNQNNSSSKKAKNVVASLPPVSNVYIDPEFKETSTPETSTDIVAIVNEVKEIPSTPAKVRTEVSNLIIGTNVIAIQVVSGGSGFSFTHKKMTEQSKQNMGTDNVSLIAKQFRSKPDGFNEDGSPAYTTVDEISKVNKIRYKIKKLVEENSLETITWNGFRLISSHNFTFFKTNLDKLIEELDTAVEVFAKALPDLIKADETVMTAKVFDKDSYNTADEYRKSFKAKVQFFTIANPSFQTPENMEVVEQAHFTKYQRVMDLFGSAVKSLSEFKEGKTKRFRIDSLTNIREEIKRCQANQMIEDKKFDDFCESSKNYIDTLEKQIDTLRDEDTKASQLTTVISDLTTQQNDLDGMMKAFFS
jgi:hypothetical protein